MKSISFLSSLTRWGRLHRTAVWLLGSLILALGLSACGGQSDNPILTVAPLAATPIPAATPDTASVEVNDSPAVPVAAQVTTGFNISGWV